MLVKLYGSVTKEEQRRYSPAKCIGTEVAVIEGNPDPSRISTSYVERQNLTMRMSIRRYTRLTNAFFKKADNLAYALGLHFMHYNFCRVHKTQARGLLVETGRVTLNRYGSFWRSTVAW